MDPTTCTLLSSALTDLIRGLKKLRVVVDRQSAGNLIPQNSVSGDKNSPDSKSEIKSEMKSEQKKAVSISNPKKAEKKTPKIPDLVRINFSQEPKDWLFHPKNNWDSFHATLNFLYGQTLRGDRYKNQWHEDKTTVKGWRKISEKHLAMFYQAARSFHDDCSSMVEYAKRKESFQFDWGHDIPQEKWDRRQELWEGDTSLKCFRKWLIFVHSSLPALNRPSVK